MEAATVAPQPAAAPAAPAARRSRGEIAAYALLVAVALVLRLWDLGDRPFHHDESQDAYFSWVFFTEGDYEYNPLLHGPLRFYLTAAMYAVFGDSDFTARLAPALMGTLMVPLPYLLRAQLGRVGAFAAALLLAFGPTYLYFSRFAREDIYIASITLALLVVVFRFLDRPRRHHPALIGVLLALSFATKESTFITVFVAGTFFLIVLVGWRDRLLVPVRAVGLDAWGWGAGRVRRRLHDPVHDLPHPPGRSLGRDLHRAWSTGSASTTSAAAASRGSSTASCCSGSSGRRCCSGPSAPSWRCAARRCCASSSCGRSCSRSRSTRGRERSSRGSCCTRCCRCCCWPGSACRRSGSAAAAGTARSASRSRRPAFAYAGYASFLVNAENRADPRELLVSTQSSEEVARVADRVVARADRAESADQPFTITVDSAEGATFPWRVVLPRPRRRLPRSQRRPPTRRPTT